MILLQPVWPEVAHPAQEASSWRSLVQEKCSVTSKHTGCSEGQCVVMEEGKQRTEKEWEGGTVNREQP